MRWRQQQEKYEQEIDVREIDRKSGNFDTFRRWLIVEEVTMPTKEVRWKRRVFEDESLNVGDYVERSGESVTFDRITTQTAKQVIVQKVREAERAMVVGSATGRRNRHWRVVKVNATISLWKLNRRMAGNAEAVILREGMLPRENCVRTTVFAAYAVRPEARGAQLLNHRSKPEC